MKQSIAITALSKESLLKHFSFLPCRRLLLVRGNSSYRDCGAEAVLAPFFRENGIAVAEFSDFSVNPKQADLNRGLAVANAFRPDAVLAIGGGSVMDMAKLIRFYLSFEENPAQGSYGQFAPCLPLAVIPTTAGTGSESTHFAVLYRDGIKHSIAHPAILPDFVLLDAALNCSATPYQTACSGLDALCQAIESCWSARSTPESREYALRALTLIYPALPKAVLERNKDAIAQLVTGANLAGRAINISFTTAPHAYSYGLTSLVGVPHGHAVACFLPYFFKLHSTITAADCHDPRGAEHVYVVMKRLAECLACDVCRTPELLRQYIIDVLPLHRQTVTLNQAQWQDILKRVNPGRLNNNPVKINSANAPTSADVLPFIRVV